VDPLGLTAAAVGSGIAFGLAVVSAVTFAVDALRSPGAAPDLGAPFHLLLWGTLAGIVLAGAMTWRLLAPLTSVYRRGGLSLVSAFATVLVMLVCIPVNQLLGRPGLAGMIGLSLIAALILARRARLAGASS
jgi:hypothetical protein